jgi:putative sterol carrier protein
VSKKQNPQQLFMTGQIRVEGDMGIVLGVMGVLQSR